MRPTPLAAIFDLDGLIIDSEPLWEQAEEEVLAELGVDVSRRDALPDCLGLRIDMVVRLWYDQQPWRHTSLETVTHRIYHRTLELLAQHRPLLPGVRQALALCKDCGLKIGLASASPMVMLERVLAMFDLRGYFSTLASAEHLPYSKPHPQVYLNAAQQLHVNPLYCVALEDSVNGMIACKAARMQAIAVPAPAHFHDPRWALADVLLPSLEALTAAHLSPVNQRDLS